ncbi:CopD family protein [Rhizobium sp. 32-5/1]|uniref:CopD family protein n=1 Tax=Rhizobium sp. 32-5/1 TaxID=3019602 RepID=UPI00240E550F|nr:CopD family protein [Rhizobium sp. 32-5/1]WEZ84975.1 CopD family protein [Rhizobium sp. 32-5/1]
MDYLWLKALHVAAIITWVGGMLAMSVAARTIPALGAERKTAIATLRKWDQRITSPAMGFAWIVGVTLVFMGGWHSAIWFMIKFVLVLALSALHGVQGGALRRMGNDPAMAAPAVLRQGPAMTITIVLLIAILVIVKPFQ